MGIMGCDIGFLIQCIGGFDQIAGGIVVKRGYITDIRTRTINRGNQSCDGVIGICCYSRLLRFFLLEPVVE